MAGFDPFRVKRSDVLSGDAPSLRDLPLQDKLFALSAILQGDTATAMKIPLLAQARRQQAMKLALETDLGAFTSGARIPERPAALTPEEAAIGLPQIEDRTGGLIDRVPGLGAASAIDLPQRIMLPERSPTADAMGLPVTMRNALPLLAKAAQGGVDIEPWTKLIEAAQPKSVVVNGRVLDERDPQTYGQFYGDAPTKGAEPVYDRNRREVGWRMADGSIQTIEAARGAEERAKARYDVVEVENSDGSKSKLPRLGFIEGYGASPSGGAPAPAAPGPGNDRPGGFNRSQTPAERARAEADARAASDRDFAAPKAYSGLSAQARATDLVLEKLEQALGQIGKGSAGLADLTKIVPGTPARDLDATLDTIRAAIGFDKLQEMRANSPTGGALGQVSDKENKLLQSVMGSLDQGQSPDQLRANLDRLRQELLTVRNERQAAFERQYGGSRATPASGATSTTAASPPAQRQPGQIYQTPRGPMKWTGTGWLPQ